jgi:4-hydroxybutyryl-CoA dehydratase/vinylacetyl-CoA-Delta-isomerase
MVPNIMYANIAKFTFAENLHQAMKLVQDISGGIPATVPAFKDWKNKELRPYIEKYLAAKDGVPTEHRLKAARLVKDFTGSYWQIANIHGEGSLAQQQMFLYFMADWKRFKAAARREANIEGWENDPTYGFVYDPREEIEKKMPPIDTSYKL